MRKMHVIFLDDSEAAGLAISMDDGFRFYAANEVFRPLERGHYRTVEEISRKANLTVKLQMSDSLNA